MKVTIGPIVIGELGTITKGLLKGLEDFEVGGRVETIQTTALLKTARILRRVPETWGDLLSSNSSEKPSANTDVKNSKGVNKNNNNNKNNLGILEADTIKQVEMKDKIQKEYLRRTRKLPETKLSSRNLIKGINTWAVSLVRYSGPFLKCTRNECKQMDQRTRKLMTMRKTLHPRDDVDRLYVSTKEEGRELASTQDSVDASIQRLEDYIEKHDVGLITALRNDTDNTMDSRMTITRKQKWEGKQLYGRFIRLINNTSHDKAWTWLRKGNLKRETESLLIATQNNAIRTIISKPE